MACKHIHKQRSSKNSVPVPLPDYTIALTLINRISHIPRFWMNSSPGAEEDYRVKRNAKENILFYRKLRKWPWYKKTRLSNKIPIKDLHIDRWEALSKYLLNNFLRHLKCIQNLAKLYSLAIAVHFDTEMPKILAQFILRECQLESLYECFMV